MKYRVVWDELTTVEAEVEAENPQKAIELALEQGSESEIDSGYIVGTARVDDTDGNTVLEPADQVKHRIFHMTALALCEHHKRTCDGQTCNIALGTLREMAEAAGVAFTQEESKRFM